MLDDAAINVYTDASKPPGANGAGCAYVIVRRDCVIKEGGEYKHFASSDEGEIYAVWLALQSLNGQYGEICLFVDSQNVYDGLTRHLHAWAENNWLKRGSNRSKCIRSKEAWQLLYSAILASNVAIDVQKVAAHSGDRFNEYVDRLARQYALYG